MPDDVKKVFVWYNFFKAKIKINNANITLNYTVHIDFSNLFDTWEKQYHILKFELKDWLQQKCHWAKSWRRIHSLFTENLKITKLRKSTLVYSNDVIGKFRWIFRGYFVHLNTTDLCYPKRSRNKYIYMLRKQVRDLKKTYHRSINILSLIHLLQWLIYRQL